MSWYFILAHWPKRSSRPLLRTTDGPARVVMGSDQEDLETLFATASLACSQGEPLASGASRIIATAGLRDYRIERSVRAPAACAG